MQERSRQSHQPHELECVELLHVQAREVHRALESCLTRWLRASTPISPATESSPVALYVHAATLEDVAIQILLRGVPPLFATNKWRGRGPARYATDDIEPVRDYARDVFAATDDYLRALPPHAMTARVDLSRIHLGRPTVAWVVSRFVILELSQIYGELMTLTRPPETPRNRQVTVQGLSGNGALQYGRVL